MIKARWQSRELDLAERCSSVQDLLAAFEEVRPRLGQVALELRAKNDWVMNREGEKLAHLLRLYDELKGLTDPTRQER
jgi:hypothetical protein